MTREPVSQKTRFEVFKRDKFTCQYCGKKAPDVVLHCDHMHPVAEGGTSDVMNLITACAGCNGGKGARRLDDMSVVERQRVQIEELEERRQQLEMMLQWRDTLSNFQDDQIQQISDYIGTKSQFSPNDTGKKHIKRWLKKFPLDELLEAIDTSFDQYLVFEEGDETKATQASWEQAFNKVPAIITWTKRLADKPHMKQIFYIRGILRKRVYCNEHYCVSLMERFHDAGGDLDWCQDLAKTVRNWTQWQTAMHEAVDELEGEVGAD
jgi:cytochrome c553